MVGPVGPEPGIAEPLFCRLISGLHRLCPPAHAAGSSGHSAPASGPESCRKLRSVELVWLSHKLVQTALRVQRPLI